MPELSINKKLRIIALYLKGFSYDEISAKTGVSKGTVANVIAALKAGQFPEVSTIPEEIEQLRDLAINIKRNGISPVQASIGLSVLARLVSLGIEPDEIEKCHTLLQALSSPDTDLTVTAKSVLAIEEVKQQTGLTLEELEVKVIALKEEVQKLEPLSAEIEHKENELSELGATQRKLSEVIQELKDRHTSLTNTIHSLELKESQLANRLADLEERAYAADKQLYEARQDLKTLSKIGISKEDLNKFTVKLKEISAHHDIKPEDLCRRLLKELGQLDKGLSLESFAGEKRSQLTKVENEIAKEEAEKEGLVASTNQLKSERLELETQLAQSRKHLAQDISALSDTSKKAVQEIRDGLKSGVENSLSEVHRIKEEALKVGKEVGRLESSIESFSWIKPLLSMIRGENGLDDYQVRVISMTVLRSMSSWLNENHGQDLHSSLLRTCIENTISELDRWKS